MFPFPRELRQLQEEIMFDKHSDFALNKLDKDAIVCPSATGIHTRLTREAFSSEEEFLYWKQLSDGDYKDTEAAGRDFYDHCISLTEAQMSSGKSVEDSFFTVLLKVEQKGQRAALLQQVKSVLTEKQYRRMWMYYVDSMTVEEISAVERVAHQNISKSICAARKKLKKFFSRR